MQNITVRNATLDDALRIADLCTQLGYPSTPDQVLERLQGLVEEPDHAVYVAVTRQGEVLGWIDLCVLGLVVVDPLVEVEGLVVDESFRSQGIGRLLMEHAEAWARRKGCREVYIRSNVVREQAHRFYLSIGYQIIKTQYAFRKRLSDAE
jgi:GNAT superfamily N-acetyltransferase